MLGHININRCINKYMDHGPQRTKKKRLVRNSAAPLLERNQALLISSAVPPLLSHRLSVCWQRPKKSSLRGALHALHRNVLGKQSSKECSRRNVFHSVRRVRVRVVLGLQVRSARVTSQECSGYKSGVLGLGLGLGLRNVFHTVRSVRVSCVSLFLSFFYLFVWGVEIEIVRT